MVTISQLN